MVAFIQLINTYRLSDIATFQEANADSQNQSNFKPSDRTPNVKFLIGDFY